MSDLPIMRAAARVQSRIQCPLCGRRGKLIKWGFYSRTIVEPDPHEQKPAGRTRVVRVQRLRCICTHTHALLDDGIVPYRRYSLEFMLRTVSTWRRHDTVSVLCELLQISSSTLYCWLDLFKTDLMAADVPYAEYSGWTRQWRRLLSVGFTQEFLLRNGRRFLERLRPIRPSARTPAGGWPKSPQYLFWPLIAHA